jgi:extracellular elastinolytic metalloproteinase
MAEPKVPANFNALYSRAARAARGVAVAVPPAEPPAVSRMAGDVPDVIVDYDEATQNPVHLGSHQPAGRLSTQSMDSPEAAARQFVKERADLWQLNDQDIATVEVVSVSAQGLPTVRMVQKVDGVEVFQSDMTAAVGPDNRVVSVAGQLFRAAGAEPTRAAARAVTARSRDRAAVPAGNLSAEEAIARAASDLTGYPYKPSDFKPAAAARSDSGAYRFFAPKWKTAPEPKRAAAKRASAKRKSGPAAPPFERPVRVKDVLFPMGEGHFVPSYFIELWIRDYPAFSYVVDAVDAPDVLFRKNLTSRVTFKYRVHNTGDPLFRPEDGPAPGTPHPTGRPDGFQAPTIAEKLIEVESLLPGRPWLAPNATTTRGNNCIAFADLKSPDGPSPGDVDGKVTAARTFGAKYDHSKPSSASVNLQNSIVGMFFHVNWLHDRWYEAGFDEASGNAQQDNFGLGGIDGDPILAEGNDFSGTDNANMSTPPDGSSPRMQMFRFDGPNPLPSRTSNHEALITFHEMGHYITNRLVGNGSGLMNVQGGAMGEGWGDFFAICMTSQASDNFTNGAFAVGGWTDITPGFKDNYYFSIRRYPYSADMSKNPLTFKHIGANVMLPVGPPRNGGGANQEEHNAGEIWCCALWEVFVNLVAAHGHVTADKRMLQYVVGGLKLTPSNPTFLQARNGILSAAGALQPADVPLIWKGFAKRGMGKDAAGPAATSTTLTGVVESFAVPIPPAQA